MAYTIQQIQGLPVVQVTLGSDFNGLEDITASTEELFRIFSALDTPHYQITDARELKMDFEMLMDFVRVGVRGEYSIANHPKNAGIIFVTSNRFYEVALNGLNTAAFGMLKVRVFDSLEAALAWVRANNLTA
ncbi:MAG: hypothetical protein SF123_06390 [Chloroflexota bacterium]|nr:hypothetical protein [Chloroflexota bacterium]